MSIPSDFVYTLTNLFPIYLDIQRFSDSFAALVLIKRDSVYAAVSPRFFRKINRIHHLVPWHVVNLR